MRVRTETRSGTTSGGRTRFGGLRLTLRDIEVKGGPEISVSHGIWSGNGNLLQCPILSRNLGMCRDVVIVMEYVEKTEFRYMLIYAKYTNVHCTTSETTHYDTACLLYKALRVMPASRGQSLTVDLSFANTLAQHAAWPSNYLVYKIC